MTIWTQSVLALEPTIHLELLFLDTLEMETSSILELHVSHFTNLSVCTWLSDNEEEAAYSGDNSNGFGKRPPSNIIKNNTRLLRRDTNMDRGLFHRIRCSKLSAQLNPKLSRILPRNFGPCSHPFELTSSSAVDPSGQQVSRVLKSKTLEQLLEELSISVTRFVTKVSYRFRWLLIHER